MTADVAFRGLEGRRFSYNETSESKVIGMADL